MYQTTIQNIPFPVSKTQIPFSPIEYSAKDQEMDFVGPLSNMIVDLKKHAKTRKQKSNPPTDNDFVFSGSVDGFISFLDKRDVQSNDHQVHKMIS